MIEFFELFSLLLNIWAGFINVFHGDLEGLIESAQVPLIMVCPMKDMGRSVGDLWEAHMVHNAVNHIVLFRSCDRFCGCA